MFRDEGTDVFHAIGFKGVEPDDWVVSEATMTPVPTRNVVSEDLVAPILRFKLAMQVT